MYSKQLANMIKNYFIDDDWNYEFDEERGLFKAGIHLECKLKSCRVLVKIEEDCFQVICTINISADEDKKAEIAEYITRANYGLKFGKFELDYRDGEIRYQLPVDCSGGAIPTEKVIERAITIPAIMFDRYGDGLLSVLFGFATPKEAIEKAEN